MKLLFLAPFIFGVLFSSVAKAQIEVEKSPKSSDNKKVKVFSNEDYFDDGGGSTDEKNLLKIDPALIFVGEVPLFYERRLNDNFSVEIGAGPTIANPMTIGFADIFSIVDGSLDYYDEDAETKLGLTYKLAMRYYPDGDGDPEGVYFGPTYHYKDFRFVSAQVDNDGNPTGLPMTMKWKFNDYMVQGGYQYEALDYLYFDAYVALGIRQKSFQYMDRELVYDPNTATSNYVYTPMIYQKNGIGYALGTKIGILF